MNEDVSVRFGLDGDAFQKGLAALTGGFTNFKSALLDSKGAILGVAGSLGLLKFADVIRDTINLGDELKSMSEVTGISVSKLSELRVAAKLSDTSLQQVAGAVKFLQRNLIEAQDAGSETGRVFEALGIDAKSALNMDPGELLKVVGKNIAGIEDAALRTAVGMKVMGRSATELTPFLNSLEQGEELAKKFGLTLTDDFGNSADELNDTLTVVGLKIDTAFTKMAIDLLPILMNVANWFSEGAGKGASFANSFEIIGTAVKLVLTPLSALWGLLKVIGNTLGGVAAAAVQAFSGDFAGALTTISAMTKNTGDIVRETTAQITTLWSDSATQSSAAVEKSVEKQKKDYGKLALAVRGSAVEKTEAERKAAEEAVKHQASAISEATKLNREFTDFYLESGKIQLTDKKRVIENELALVQLGTSEEIKLRRDLAEVEKQLQEQIQTGIKETVEVTDWWASQFEQSMLDIGDFAKDAFSTFSNGFGRAVADAIVEGKSLKDGLRNIFEDIAKSFIAQVTTMMIKWAALQAMQAVGLSPVAGAASGAVSGMGGVGGLATAGTGLLATMGPVGWGAVALVALAAFGKDGVEKMTDQIKNFIKEIPSIVKQVLRELPSIVRVVIREAPGIFVELVKAMHEVVFIIIRELFKVSLQVPVLIGKAILEMFDGMSEGFKKVLAVIFTPFLIVAAFAEEIVSAVKGALETILSVIEAVVGLVDQIFGWIEDIAGSIGGGILGGGGGTGNDLLDKGVEIITNPFGGIGDAADDVADFFGFASGGSFMTTRPQMFLAGERGPERITVSPAGTPQSLPGGGAQGGSYVFNGPVFMDEITMRNFARMQGRMASIEAQRYAR